MLANYSELKSSEGKRAALVDELPSALPRELIQAYRETNYRVHLGAEDVESFILKVATLSEPLERLHRKSSVDCSAFITACNPWSRPTSDGENTQRMDDLMKILQARSLRWHPGSGQHPVNEWPAEPSILVMGLSLAAAKVLARSFDQNAFIWTGSDAVPQLVLLA